MSVPQHVEKMEMYIAISAGLLNPLKKLPWSRPFFRIPNLDGWQGNRRRRIFSLLLHPWKNKYESETECLDLRIKTRRLHDDDDDENKFAQSN